MADESGTFVDDGFTSWLDGFGDPVDNAEEVFREYANVIEEDARENAPWTDRTGAARAGLRAEVDRGNEEIVLYLYHTVEYGIYLETMQSGAFAILLPTLEKYAKTVFENAGGEVIGTTGGFGL